MPEFKAAFRFKDLYKNNPATKRMIELITPLYYFRERHFQSAKDIDEDLVFKTFIELVQKRRNSISPEQVAKLKQYKDVATMRSLKKLDKSLREIDFEVFFDTVNVSINITGNQYHSDISNQRVIELGFKNQLVRISKASTTL